MADAIDNGSAAGTTSAADPTVTRLTKQIQDLQKLQTTSGAYSLWSYFDTKISAAQKQLTDYNTSRANAASGIHLGGSPSPDGYRFNLPPHKWSLPVRPGTDEPFVGTNQYDSFHGLRRGRIWFWQGADQISTFDANGNVTTTGAQASAAAAAQGKTVQQNTDPASLLKKLDNRWAFQFLWNPSSFTTSVSRNGDVTPSSADVMKVSTGAFPGQEQISINLMIDRVNDFACIKAYQSDSAKSTANSGSSINFTNRAVGPTNYISDPNSIDYSSFVSYYTNNGYPGAAGAADSGTVATKVQKLMAQGTMADIEYLYKAINGGADTGGWYNLLGKETADIGFLLPNLLAVQLGPTIDSLSYVGWVTSLSVTHTDFTENMIPIRSQVTINMDCFSGQGLSLA